MARLVRLLTASLLVHSICAAYTLVRDYSPSHFFDQFDFFDGDDPTHGAVAYQSRRDAAAKVLISSTNSTVRIGVDSTNKVDDLRPSVRISSSDKYYQGILLVDVMHMPSGCGTWPALWMLGDGDWPMQGEIDILEGANDQPNNYMTLHTSNLDGDACSIDALPPSGDDGSGALGYSKKDYTGTVSSSNCTYNAETNDNTGCQIRAPTGSSAVYAGSGKTTNAVVPTFGRSLNSESGGTVAMQWTDEGIKVWFFGRAQSKPADVAAAINLTATPPTLAPSDDAWGRPMAHFSGSDCNWAARFRDMRIVINVDLCGDWGAATWQSESSCPATTGYDSCENYVKENPQAFSEAYWEFGAFRWFEWQDPAPPAPTTTAASSTRTSASSSTSASNLETITIKMTKTETAISTSSSSSFVIDASTSSAAPAAPTVIYSTISAPSTTHRPFTYAPASPTVATTTSVVAETSEVSSSSAIGSHQGNAQYLVNGKLPLGGAGIVTVPWMMVIGGTAFLAVVLL